MYVCIGWADIYLVHKYIFIFQHFGKINYHVVIFACTGISSLHGLLEVADQPAGGRDTETAYYVTKLMEAGAVA